MTEVIYLEVSEKTETARKAGRRVSVMHVDTRISSATKNEPGQNKCPAARQERKTCHYQPG